MKFTPEVVAALAVLRANAENDFERHRINVLERDLTAPPVVEIIDDTHQRFNGMVYTRTSTSHFATGTQIHRAVYRYYRGDFPKAYHIHHIDENPSNNTIENLQCLSASEHRAIHNMINSKKYICEFCGKEFYSSAVKEQVKFCSSVCQSRSYSESQREIRQCAICGKEFSAKKYSRTFCCSTACATKSASIRRRKPKPKCPVCGVEVPNRNRKYCSRSCAIKARWQRKWASRKKKERICPVCGKVFIPSQARVKCCSKECGVKLSHQHRKKPLIKKSCPICGKIFLPSSSSVVCCSHSCGAKLARQKELPEKTCPVCGIVFRPSISIQKYCSDACRIKEKIKRECERKRAKKQLT